MIEGTQGDEVTEPLSIQPKWCLDLPLQQQSVLMLAARGPDGIPKTHPCKDVQRAYRATVLMAARYGRMLNWGEHADTFMSLRDIAKPITWTNIVNNYYSVVDQLPHHFIMHLLHGAEILAYKHPKGEQRGAWTEFYLRGCQDLHLTPETIIEMDLRLNDWDRASWESPVRVRG